MPNNILLMENMTKVYPNGFVANKNITFSVEKGEIHALLGENGAGKTTLMKMLFGFEKPDAGRILIDGQQVEIHNALEAIKHGIGMVHQHFMLVPSLSVAENLILGDIPKGPFFTFNAKKAAEITEELGKKYNMRLNPADKVQDLSVGGKQKLEILKALLHGAKILILDEPTAVLTPQETEELFVTLKQLSKDGHTIIFISHKLDEVVAICDRFTILRRGKQVGEGSVQDVTPSKLSALMVGREVDLNMHKEEVKRGDVVLQVRDLVYINDFNKPVVDGVSFCIHENEILGIAAVEGNGQNEIAEIVCGLKPADKGEVIINDRDISRMSIRQRRENGISYIPEDRMTDGCSAVGSINDNIIADRYYKPKYSGKVLMKKKVIREETASLIEQYDIMCMNQDQPIGMLSGGNIQKVIVSREFSGDVKLVVANQPTRGIDVGAAEFIRHQLVDISRRGKTGALLVSADLTELLTVSDSLIVLVNGKITAYFPDTSKIDEFVVGEYMLGVKVQTEEEIGGVNR